MVRIRETDEAFDEGASVLGGQTFEEAASLMPDNARSGFGSVTPSPESPNNGTDGEGLAVMAGDGESEPPKTTRIKMSRKMKAAMKKIQDKVSSAPILYFRGKAKQYEEWKLDEDEEEMIKESISFFFEVLNIEFLIEPLNYTLTSIWWVVAYPIAIFGMVFVTHKAAADAAHPKEEGDEDAK
jgi:hypothetical protein